MVNYKIKDDVAGLIVCLYNPSAREDKYTTDSLLNYVNACGWQLQTGEKPRRIPFHLTPSLVDAKREIESMQRIIQENRREQNKQSDK